MTGATASDVWLLLTATVDPKGMILTKRSDPKARMRDYVKAFKWWLRQSYSAPIILCENSGADLSGFARIAREQNRHKKPVHLLSFEAPLFPRTWGKGYGEMLILSHVLNAFPRFTATTRIMKMTGRYTVRNLRGIVAGPRYQDSDIQCDLSPDRRSADSRMFVASVGFLREYLCPMRERVNDGEGIFIEHVLAEAVVTATQQGMKWAGFPVRPDICGISGSDDRSLGIQEAAQRFWYPFLAKSRPIRHALGLRLRRGDGE